MKRAVYAGSFDPPTNGHMWMIDQANKMFDLTIVIAANADKRSRFTFTQRDQMMRTLWSGRIMAIENELLARWATANGFDVLIRGMRNVHDFEYESAMGSINQDIAPGISTVFLVPPRRLRDISSSMVMGLVGIAGWEDVVTKYVPPAVLAALKGIKR